MNLIAYKNGDLVWVIESNVFKNCDPKLALIVDTIYDSKLSEIIEYKVYFGNIIKYVYPWNITPF